MSANSNATREPAEYASSTSEIAYGRVVSDANGVVKDGNGATPQTVIVAVVDPASAERDEAARQKRYRRREQYRIATLVLLTITLASALATFAIAVVVFCDCSTFRVSESDSPGLDVLGTFMLYIFVIIESILSIVAMITLIVHACRCPERVLLRAPFDQGKFSCLLTSLVVLLLFAGYSFAAPIIMKTSQLNPPEPVEFCIAPAARIVLYAGIIGVLSANRCLR